MSEKPNARELAFHYLASQHETLNEEEYLKKFVSAEAKFTELLASAAQYAEDVGMKVWETLGRKP